MGDKAMDEETLRREASTPMTGAMLAFTQGPWGSGDDIITAARHAVRKAGMSMSEPRSTAGILQFSISGGDASDLDYLHIVDMLFSRFPDYLPQMTPITEAGDGD